MHWGMSDSEEELAQNSPLSRRVRWIAWSAVAALAVTAAVVLATRASHSTRHPTAAPTHASPVVPAPNVRTSTRPRTTVPPRTAVAGADGIWWEVQGRTLYVESASGRPHKFARSIALPPQFAAPGSRATVAVDPVTGWVWVVLEDSSPSFMLRVSARSARIMREIRWPTPVRDVAAYARQLYLSTDQGTATLPPHGKQPRMVPELAGVVGPLAADPMRHRVIALDLVSHPARIWAVAPDTSPVQSDASFSADRATIAIVGRAIWILATNGTHASLRRLDSTTLRPTRSVRLPDGLSARAILASGDDGALWLSGDRLVCADPTTGTALHAWPYRDVDSVASGRGRALIAAGSRFYRVSLRPCRAVS